jgi:hypothetical protein
MQYFTKWPSKIAAFRVSFHKKEMYFSVAYLISWNSKFLFLKVKLLKKKCRIWLTFNVAVMIIVSFCMSLYLITVTHGLWKLSVNLIWIVTRCFKYTKLYTHMSSLEANTGSVRQHLSRLLWKPKVHSRVERYLFLLETKWNLSTNTSKCFR